MGQADRATCEFRYENIELAVGDAPVWRGPFGSSTFPIPHFELAVRKHLAGITLAQLVRKVRRVQ
jgi:hypothetical protein